MLKDERESGQWKKKKKKKMVTQRAGKLASLPSPRLRELNIPDYPARLTVPSDSLMREVTMSHTSALEGEVTETLAVVEQQDYPASYTPSEWVGIRRTIMLSIFAMLLEHRGEIIGQ